MTLHRGTITVQADGRTVDLVCESRDPADIDLVEKVLGSVRTVVEENARLRAALSDFAEGDCEYGDGCPTFGSRHGKCIPCRAHESLRTTSARKDDGKADP